MDWKFRGDWWTEVDGRRVSDKQALAASFRAAPPGRPKDRLGSFVRRFRFEYQVMMELHSLMALVFASGPMQMSFQGHFQYISGTQDRNNGVSLVAHVRDVFGLAPVMGPRPSPVAGRLPLFGDGRSAHGRYAQRAILTRASNPRGSQFAIDISRVYSDRLIWGPPFQGTTLPRDDPYETDLLLRP